MKICILISNNEIIQLNWTVYKTIFYAKIFDDMLKLVNQARRNTKKYKVYLNLQEIKSIVFQKGRIALQSAIDYRKILENLGRFDVKFTTSRKW